MDVRRRTPTTKQHHRTSLKQQPNAGELLKQQSTASQDSLPLPLYLTNGLFFTMFFSVMYFLLIRWREKIRNSTPLHVLTISEMAALISLIASFVYLLGFFGIDFVQSVIRPSPDSWALDDDQNPDQILLNDDKKIPCGLSPATQNDQITTFKKPPPSPSPATTLTGDDEEIVNLVVSGALPSYLLETRLGDCRRAAAIRREALQRITGKSLEGLPLDGFDYDSILGQCCEMPVGYVQIPVGIAGPLLLNGAEYSVPMATTEGCLVASTNRGCKAIYVSGGATSVLLKDGMTRAPVVRFGTARRAADLKFFLEDPLNFDTLAVVFNM